MSFKCFTGLTVMKAILFEMVSNLRRSVQNASAVVNTHIASDSQISLIKIRDITRYSKFYI